MTGNFHQERNRFIRPRSFIIGTIAVLFIIALIVLFLFNNLTKQYKGNISLESAEHLTEISYQIKLNLEKKVALDWNATYSVANSLIHCSYDDTAELLEYLGNECDIWNISDIIVYNEDGYCICVSGEIISNDEASKTIVKARTKKEYLTFMKSSLTYSVPVDTELELEGARIAAISVVQDLSSYLDSMNFSSFGGAAYMYLTQPNGIVISMLTHPDAVDTFNISTLFTDEELTCINEGEHTSDEILNLIEPLTYLGSSMKGDRYIVSMPVLTSHADMNLFYIVPENIVNKTITSFSSYVLLLTVIIVLIISIAVILIFVTMYRLRSKKFDKALLLRERMFDLLIQNTKNAFALFSLKQEKPLYSSANVENVLGFVEVGLIREPSGFRLVPSGEADEAMLRINKELSKWNGRDEFVSEYVPLIRENSSRYYVVRIYPIEGSDDEYVGIAQDITQEQERETALKTALSLADQASASKTRFLANMSHDIRTPMNAIINMTDFAFEQVNDDKLLLGYLNTIRDSSRHLLELINDVLDMSRIESGQTMIAQESFSMRGTVESACEVVRPLYEAKEQYFDLEFNDIRSDMLIGDRLKLSQIFINITNNAVKFTPRKGKISFIVNEEPALRPDTASYVFKIKDSGMGIPAERLPYIFEAFMRGDNRRINGIEGTGLGLSICKSYVNAMGGAISCESTEGEGSTFTITLTFVKVQEDTENSALSDGSDGAEMNFEGKCALLCEDNEINRMIAEKILERIGFKVEAAADGREGVDMFEASEPGHFDVIYMDIQMPVMDGYEATEIIRKSSHPQASTVPIIAMTANVFIEDIERSRTVGMNGHIGKPLVIGDMINATKKVIQGGSE